MSNRDLVKGSVEHEAFSQMKEANGLQFSTKTEVLPLNNWKSAESIGVVGNKRENRHHFEVLVSYEYSQGVK